MQITETSSDGLKRELKVTIPQGELSQRFVTRLDEVKDTVQLKGFRKGKVPVAHLKKLFGRSLMAEVLQQAVDETSRDAIKERNERAAHQPNINLTEDKDEIERVLSGESDLAFTMSYEALPDIKITDLAVLQLEREVADVMPEAVDKAVGELMERSVRYEVEAERAAGDGDRVSIDYLGRIDGTAFEGGKGEDVQLIVGQSNFIPGFVEGIKGAKAGEERAVNAKFPDAYPQKDLAGKDAVFDVRVKEVAKPIRPELNDDFAKTLGAESLDKLKELVSSKIASEYASITRMQLKQQILDALDKAHDFPLPRDARHQRVRWHLEAADPEPGAGGQDLCRRGQERGRAQGRVPQNRRAARAPRPRHRRDRREERAAGEPGGAAARAHRAGAALSGPGEVRLRVLREEPGGADRAARADLRGQGDRPHPGPGDAHREEGDGRGADQVGGCGRWPRPWPRPRVIDHGTTMVTTTMVTTISTAPRHHDHGSEKK